MVTTLLRLAAVLAGAATAVCLSVALAPADATTSAPGRQRPIIVDVTGDAANGFGIEYADGTGLYPPTDSEVLAECSEYDRRLDRVRCRVEMRTWYRDLGDMKRAFAHLRGEM